MTRSNQNGGEICLVQMTLAARKAAQMTVGDWILDGYCLLLLANIKDDWLIDRENLPSENPIPSEGPIIQREEEIINRLEEIPRSI